MGEESKQAGGERGKQGWLARHLDGWQAGAIALVLIGSAVFLAVPRAVEPSLLPPPRVDRRALTATMAQDDTLARQAEREPLDVDIRAVGRELRSYNDAAAHGKQREMAAARSRIISVTKRALGRSEEQLLRLRAYQLSRFLQELREWQRTGTRSAELDQLGGEFLEQTRRNRWCADGSRRLLLDEAVLRVFFKKRWSDLTGVDAGAFALTLDEDRVRFGFFLRHPLLPQAQRSTDTPLDRQRLAAQRSRARLAIIGKLGARDPSYPTLLAQGIELYRTQRFAQASEAFRKHLDASPDGPYALRAQNHMKAALDKTRQGLF